MNFSKKLSALAFVGVLGMSTNAFAVHCPDLPSFSDFTSAVDAAYQDTLGLGFGLGMWATLMNTAGEVCYVYSVDGDPATANGGADAGNTAWLGSRVISAQKANTANAFSLDGLSIPTGAVTVATYEGGSLFGLQFSNPVDTQVAYEGDENNFGTEDDPLAGNDVRVGGINVFGGGIALYEGGVKVGSVGVSGDTSCRDAAMAWVLRDNLGYNNPPGGPGADDLQLVIGGPVTALFQQPACGVNDPDDAGLYGVYIVESEVGSNACTGNGNKPACN